MTQEVLQYIRKEKLIQEDDCIFVGLSGGADSVCLLLILAELRKELNFFLEAIHVEHGIRGEESRQDAGFAEDLCAELGIKCHTFHVDVPKLAKKQGLGLEEAARIGRYQCFYKVTEQSEKRNNKIAVAHHADDNAETVLFQMIRGSGIDGLCGMQPAVTRENGMTLIRPLLKVNREQIENFLKEREQEFCVDSTNTDVEYSRNRIRHLVLPELTKVNAKAVAHINQSASMLSEFREYLEAETRRIYARLVEVGQDGGVLCKPAGKEIPSIMFREVIHLVIAEVAGGAKDISAVHITAVEELFALQVGRKISLPYGIVAQRIYEGVSLCKKKEDSEEAPFFLVIKKEQLEENSDKNGLVVEVPGGRMRFKVLEFCGEMQEISKKTYTKWVKYDSISGSLQLRNRQEGDYLTLDEQGHRKRLKEYFINEKIPSSERNKVLLLTQDSSVIWVIGKRIGAEYKIDRDTKRVLEVEFLEEETHEN